MGSFESEILFMGVLYALLLALMFGGVIAVLYVIKILFFP